ncbi:uncharacterized protein LOC103719530 isoform X1 [Phoenix dactylifera]|uniref:Uncharacterized protein LOC103719530 isoform X1 n=1 Tax=Phoenix dactylifera TaxID=42345 RepID=A0A8B8JBY3_PHODC|nr:uncharacterized protein LOC103719530 isoform X1 [Phoenix dactylifera]XP_038987170.1 uncharacterized protein LOC103719530 isoform X1 [Phoenix dactylifera]XP_038987171.1 uncharacterized protein LOC103719530 isoform X1 [Phoenix dactylifera]
MHMVKTHDRETHGMSNDIDENTPIDKVKGPNVFERAKEEIEAIVEAIHSKREPHHDPPTKKEESVVEAPNLADKANKEAKTLNRVKTHDKETHGTSNDIDENTPIEKVKGPGVFERAKEEIEALVGTIHPKKEHNHEVYTNKEGGFWGFLGRMFEKFCSPMNGKRD